MSGVPASYERWLSQLSASQWRERKQAADALRTLVQRDRGAGERLTWVAERLLDGLVSIDGIEGRAACHEVLLTIGTDAVDAILGRLASLNRSSPGARLLVDLLGDIGEPTYTARLRAFIIDEATNPNLRASAALAFGRISQDPEPLIALLREPNEMLQIHALDALQTMGAAVPIAVLTPLLSQPFIRRTALSLLGASRDPDAISVLIAAFDDRLPGVRSAAIEALDRLVQDLELIHLGTPIQVLREMSEPCRVRLREHIREGSMEVRMAAIRIATLAADKPVVALLPAVMTDSALHDVALKLVEWLGADVADEVAALMRVPRDGDGLREFRLRLVAALGDHASAELRAQVEQELDDPSEDVRVAAASALGASGDRASWSMLLRTMSEPGRTGEAAGEALAAILLRTSTAGEFELDEIVGRPWPTEGAVACNLCRVIGVLGWPRYALDLVLLLGSSDVAVRLAAAQALGEVPGEQAGPSALTLALTDESSAVRAAACRSLGRLMVHESVEAVLGSTRDSSAFVRAAAVQTLVAFEHPVALARLREIVSEDPVVSVVVQAVEGLGRLGGEQDLVMLMSLCTSDDWEVVKAASRALGHFAAHRATAALLGLLGHERWDVRWTAAEVLSRRGDVTAQDPLRQALANEADPLVRDVLRDAVERLKGGSDA